MDREQRLAEEPECRRLKEENERLDTKLLATKKEQEQTHKEIEALRAKRSAVTHQKARHLIDLHPSFYLCSCQYRSHHIQQQVLIQELSQINSSITSTRSRIVQSPERIKKNIVDMAALIGEEKKVVSAHEGRTRELDAKLDALSGFEEVSAERPSFRYDWCQGGLTRCRSTGYQKQRG